MISDNIGTIAFYGSHAVIWILISLSVLSIGAIIERAIWFARRRCETEELAKKVLEYLRRGDVPGAKKYLSQFRHVEGEILHEVLDWYDAGPDAFAEALSATVRAKRKKLESNLLFLGTLGNNAPFVGLFGTVLGVVTAFQELGTDAVGAMGNVMSGIAEALIATAVGILVALPAVAAFNAFQKRALDVEENAAQIAHLILAELKRTPGSSKQPQSVLQEVPQDELQSDGVVVAPPAVAEVSA